MDLKLVCAHNADSEQLVLPSQHNLEVTTSNEPDTNTNDNDAMNIVHETGVILAENNCTSLEENKGPDILKLIGEEARQLQASIENIAPDMDILSKQLSNLSNKVRASKLKQDSRVSRLMMELDFLKVYISQSKADIGAMDSFITKLLIDLTGNPRNSGSTETVTAQKRLEDCTSDCDSPTTVEEGTDTTYLRDAEIVRPAAESHDAVLERSTTVAESDDAVIQMEITVAQSNNSLIKRETTVVESDNAGVQSGTTMAESNDALIEKKTKGHEVKGLKSIPCLICIEIFYHKNDLQTHLNDHAVDKDKLKCRICEQYFNDPTSLREHILEHNKSGDCEMCGKHCPSKWSLRDHMESHRERFPCNVCGRVMKTASRLEDHMNVHSGEKPYECEICHEKISSRSALRNHRGRVHGKKTGTKCLICGKIFKTPIARNTHLLKHTEEERRQYKIVMNFFTCKVCGKTVRCDHKSSHMNKHKDKIERIHVCDICGRQFSLLSHLRMHMTLHKHEQKKDLSKVEQGLLQTLMRKQEPAVMIEGSQPGQICPRQVYVCDIPNCGKTFTTMSSLGLHKRLHNNDRPYACGFCKKSFVINAQLKLHEKKHYGNEPFKCSLCDKRFLYKISYQTHMNMHTGDRPFPCHICKNRFSSKNNQARHVAAVHQKIRRFICSVCGKSFASKSAFQVHERIHTGEKPLCCDICGRFFSDPSTLYKHKAIHAKNLS